MKSRNLFVVLCLSAAILVSVSNVSAADKVNAEQSKLLPRVLLIGDSICGGYQKDVKKLLAGKAVVVKNKGNAQHTQTGLEKLDEWLGDGNWDVIHFNWGLHDLCYRHPSSKVYGNRDKINGTIDVPLGQYEKNLVQLVVRLKRTGAKLIFATTTVVPEGEAGRFIGDDVKYNAVAVKVMKQHGVAVNDLHSLTKTFSKDMFSKPGDVHFNKTAYGRIGRQVADKILEQLSVPEVNGEAKKSIEQLQRDFRKLKFGMFIHYNMATYKGVQWIAGYPDPSDFNPGGKVDTDAWADAAVSAGMKYGVLTAKHVAGFCLWDSKYTTYDVMHPDCPYQKDLVAQFIKSFKSRGLKVGLYYCWRNPGFDAGKNKGKFKVLPPECDPATHTLEEQNEFQMRQIAELIEKYPDVFYIWNDGLDPEIMPAEEAADFFKSTHPNILTSSNWWDWGKKGTPYVDIAVKEMRHFPETNKAPGETCWCLEQGWFWKEGTRCKRAGAVIDIMNKANSRNSNFLLNVGPDKNGKFEESSIKTLAEIGKLWKP
jgi:alpha-L-fucosidase